MHRHTLITSLLSGVSWMALTITAASAGVPYAVVGTTSQSVGAQGSVPQSAQSTAAGIQTARQALVRVYLSSYEDVAYEGLCGSGDRRALLINIGIEALANDDATLTTERARAARQQLHANDAQLLETCRRLVPTVFKRDDSPLRGIEKTIERGIDQLSPADLAIASEYMETSAARALESLQREVASESDREFMNWFTREGPAFAKDVVATVLAEHPPKDATAAPRARDPNRTMTSPVGGPVGAPPHPPSAGARPWTPARLLNRDTLAQACAPFYPTRSRMLGEEGSVIINLYISADGTLQNLLVEVSSGYPALDVATAACVGAVARFAPVQQEGRAVASWQRMKYTWNLTEGETPAPPPSPPPDNKPHVPADNGVKGAG